MTARPGLFADDDSGNGVTAPQDARLAMAGMLTAGGSAGPLDAQAGIIYGPGDPLKVTGSSSGPNMIYTIAAGPVATARGTSADGLVTWVNDAPYTADSGSPAPSSGKRWDLIWCRHKDAYSSDGFSDADSEPEFGVFVGTASSTPDKATAYSDLAIANPGALVLAEASVGTSIANASLATITQVAPYKAMRGAPIPVRSSTERDALTAYTGLQVFRIDTKMIETYNGTAWIPARLSWQYVKTAVNSIATATYAKMVLDTVAIDPTSLGVSGGNFTAPVAGIYRVSGLIAWSAPGSGSNSGRRGGQYQVNGTAVPGSTVLQRCDAGTSTWSGPLPTMLVSCAAGASISLYGYHEQGAALSTAGGMLMVELVG